MEQVIISGRNDRCLAKQVSMAMSGVFRAIASSSGWRSDRISATIVCTKCVFRKHTKFLSFFFITIPPHSIPCKHAFLLCRNRTAKHSATFVFFASDIFGLISKSNPQTYLLISRKSLNHCQYLYQTEFAQLLVPAAHRLPPCSVPLVQCPWLSVRFRPPPDNRQGFSWIHSSGVPCNVIHSYIQFRPYIQLYTSWCLGYLANSFSTFSDSILWYIVLLTNAM